MSSTGADGILLGGETFGGLYPVETIKTVRNICAEVSPLLPRRLELSDQEVY